MARPKPIISSIDEIPEGETLDLRGCYVEATQEEADEFNDGKPFLRFDLDRVGGWGVANTPKLTRALETARKAERTLLRYGDITPEAAKTAVEKVGGLEADLVEARKGNKAAGDWETQKNDLVAAHRGELETRDTTITTLRGDLHSRVVRGDALAALKGAGFGDHAELMVDTILPSLRYASGSNGTVGRTQVHRDGTERLNASAQPMTPMERAQELAGMEKYEILLDADGASGAGGKGGGGGGDDKPAGRPRVANQDDELSVDEIDKVAEGEITFDLG